MSLGGSQKCATCAKSVYPMERLVVDGIVFHKGKCFVCAECKGALRPGNYASLSGKYYCKPHFKKLFQVKGNYSEGFGEEDPKKKWAPTGIAAPPKDMKSAAAAGKSTQSKPEVVSGTPASRPARDSYVAEGDKPASQGTSSFSANDFYGSSAPKKEEPAPAPKAEPTPAPKVEPTPAPKAEPTPAPKVEPTPAPKAAPAPKATPAAASPAPKSGLGGSQKCATCAKSVYPMERLVVDGIIFHKGKCFVCAECKGALRPGNYASLSGKYYCKPHFKKLFQVKGNYSEGFGEEDPKKRWAPSGIAAPPKDMKSAAAAGKN